MTFVLIKLLVCPRLRDDSSGRLAVFQHKLVILSQLKAEQYKNRRLIVILEQRE